jgi:glycosyltransferase involved in cell wall biosynthesis
LKSKLTVISNGIEAEKIFGAKPDKEKLKKKYKLGKFNIIYVGRIWVEKSLNVVLDSFKLVQEKIPESRLIIVGDGPEKENLVHQTQELGLEKKVVFTGKIEHEKLIKSGIIKVCDIFVTASKTENQPLTVMEAMASSLPIIGVKKLGLIELIKNNENGYLARPDDPKDISKYIIKLFQDKRLREKMGKKSLNLIKKHSIKKTGDRLEKLYSKVSLIPKYNLFNIYLRPLKFS